MFSMNRFDLAVQDASDDAETRAKDAAEAKAKELGAPQRLNPDSTPWTCPDCGKTTDPPEAVDVGEARFVWGITPACECTEEAARLAEEEARREAAPRLAGLAVAFAGVPPRYGDCSFDGFEARPGTENMVKAAKDYAAGFGPDTTAGLYLTGPVGTGKTHIAVATARRIAGYTSTGFLFVDTKALLHKMRNDFDGNGSGGHELHRKASGARLLVLDDIAQERVSEWGREQVYTLVDARYQRALPTLITSNSADAQLRALYGPALVSRLYEMTRAVKVDANDYRAEMAKARAA